MKLFRLLVLAGIVSSVSAEANKNSTLDLDAVTGATEIVSQSTNETMTRADSIRASLKNEKGTDVLIIAHRGDWHGSTENSLEAIGKAITKGAQIASVDVKKDEQGDIVLNTEDDKKPTLKEALEYAKGKILLMINNPQNYLSAISSEAKETGTEDEVILYNSSFEGFMHTAKVNLDGTNALQTLKSVLKQKPIAVELDFKSNGNALLQEAIKMVKGKARIMFNTRTDGLSGSYTDASVQSGYDPDKNWGELIRMGGTVFDTDQIKPFLWYLHPETKLARPQGQTGQGGLDAQNSKNNERGGAGHDNLDKSYDTQLTAMKKAVIPNFKTYSFEDKTVGRTMKYNLYLPKDYEQGKSYPMVLFMPDASTVGKGSAWALEQGYGGIIWATEANQKKNPCIVLVPSFDGPDAAVNDNWETSDEVKVIPNLVEYIVSNYKVDRNRIYTTGQSMGGMISFYLNVTHPDLFAASMFVSSQWDTNVLQPLVGKKFFYIVSDADAKASPKMTELGKLLTKNGEKYSEVTFSARLPIAEQNAKVDSIIKEGCIANFVRFTPNTVMPKGRESGMAEHMYAFDRAYLLDSAREWLFRQTK
jgi:pimeloyl-ACP methyl ester carboxylesterase